MKEIKDVLSPLGVEVSNQYKCYSLDYKTMQQEEQKIKEDKNSQEFIKLGKIKLKDKWSQEDDCYYFFFRQQIDGIPVADKERGSADNGTYIPATYIEVLYSKDGIVSLSNSFTYKKIKTEQENQQLIALDSALNAVKSIYDSVILTDETTIKSIKLEYVLNFEGKDGTNYKLQPSWRFDISQKTKEIGKSNGDKSPSDKTYETTRSIFIDAITGKEML